MEHDQHLSNACSALDNEQKIRVIQLILQNNNVTVTDVRNKLNLSFSTAHKYLTDFEKAGLTISKTVMENGKKKRFYNTKDFTININPQTLLEGNAIKEKQSKQSIEVVNKFGMKGTIGIKEVINRLVTQGLSPGLAKELVHKLKAKTFKGMFAREVEEQFIDTINEEIQKLESIKKKAILQSTPDDETRLEQGLVTTEKTLIGALSERGFKEVVTNNKEGTLYIRNIRRPLPINLQHDLSKIVKYGPKVVGLETKPPKRIETALSHIDLVLNASKNNMAGTQQSIDYLNVYLAPYLKDLNDKEVEQAAQALMFKINDFCKISKSQVGIGLEFEVPKHLKKQPALVGGKSVGTLGDYEAEAHKLRNAIIDQAVFEGFAWPRLMFKFRKTNYDLPENFEHALKSGYVINLNPGWQQPNAFYTLDWSRLSYDYKGREGSTATGELQSVTINVPRIGYKNTKEKDVLTEVEKLVEQAKEVHLTTYEEILARQLTGLRNLTHPYKGVKYIDLENGLFQVRFSGMKDFLDQVNGNTKLVKRILKTAESTLKKDSLTRSELGDVDFTLLNQRFAELDKKKFNSKKDYYHGGLNLDLPVDESIKYWGEVQPILKGGHCAQFKEINMDVLDKVLKSKIGMAASHKAMWLI